MAGSKNSKRINGYFLAGLASLASCVAPEARLERLAQQPSQPPVAANGSKPSGLDYSVKAANKYLARIGVIFADEPVLQTSLTYSDVRLPGFSVNYFENRRLGDGELTETDLTLRYGESRQDFDWSVKADYVFLDAFTSFRDALEVGARVSTKKLPLTLGGEFNAITSPDNTREVGTEAILSARKDLSLISGLTANVWGDVHFNNHYFTGSDEFSVANAGAGLKWDVFGNGLLSVSADAQKQYTLGDEFDNQEIISTVIGGSLKF